MIDKTIEYYKATLMAMKVILVIMIIGIIVATAYSSYVIKEKDRTINNLQNELLMVKEENLDITNLNAELIEEVEELSGEKW